MQEKAQGFLPLNLPDILSSAGTAAAWLGGAGFLIAHGSDCLLLDPCLHIGADGLTETGHTAFYPMPLEPETIPAHAAVVYTHADGDHMGLPTALRLPKSVHIYAPARCIRLLTEAGIEAKRLHLIRPGDEFDIGSMRLTVIAATHSWQVSNPALYGEPYGPEDCVGYAVKTPSAHLLFTGDTLLCPHHMELKDEYDAIALDVSDDPYHLGHKNMVRLAKHLGRAKLMPNHFGTYDSPDAFPYNGSLTAIKALLGEDAQRVLPDVIGMVYTFGKGEA